MSAIVEALLPVFFVLALGYGAGRWKAVDNQNVSSLNTLVMSFALPVAMFSAIAKSSRSVVLDNGWLALILIVTMFISYGLIWVLERKVFHLDLSDAAVQSLTAALPNYAAVGLSLAGSVFGDQATLAVAVSIACGSVSVSPLTLALLEIGADPDMTGSRGRVFLTALGRSVRKPIFLGPIIGLAWVLIGIPLPSLAVTTLGTIGNIAGGTALFLTGLILSAQKFRVDANVTSATVLKNIVQPLIGALLVLLLPVPDPYGRYAILLLAIPAGFFGVLFGLNKGVRTPVAGGTLVLSSVASIVTLAVTIALVS